MSKEENKEELEQQEEVQENEAETQESANEEEVEQEVSSDDKIVQLEAKVKEAEEKYLRVHADFENIKKRLEREKYQAIEYASEKFS